MLSALVCLFMAVCVLMFCNIRSVQNQPQLATNIIWHLTFSKAIREHKSLGTWQGEGLIAIEDLRCLEGLQNA
jgi:hypothetical protein